MRPKPKTTQDASDPDRLFAATAFREIILGPPVGSAHATQDEPQWAADAESSPEDVRVTLAVRCHRMLPTEALCVAYRAADDGDGDACEQWNVLPMNPCSAAVQHRLRHQHKLQMFQK